MNLILESPSNTGMRKKLQIVNHGPFQSSREMALLNLKTVFILKLGVLAIHSLIDDCRGVILEHYGEVVLVNEFTLVKINVKLIIDNEEHLVLLHYTLLELAGHVKDTQILSNIKELATEIRDQLSDSVPLGITESDLHGRKAKRSLLPFIGSALKSVFGVSTEDDTNKLEDRLTQIERWVSEQGSVLSTVIDSVNANVQDIKSIANYVNQ